jgi:polysaccharide biosynthesis transport protein
VRDGEGQSAADHPALRDYLQVLRRRKWVVLQAVVLVPLSAVAFSLQQSKLYESTAEVLVSRQNLASALTGTSNDPANYQQPDRLLQTQASLARVPDVARRTLAAASVSGREIEDFLEASSVTAKTNADLLVFRVTDEDARIARRLASEYARQFTEYRRELDTGSLEQARSDVATRLRELEAAGERQTPLYERLAENEQQLRLLEALQTSNAFVVRTAAEAEQVRPRPVRNAVLGLALGLFLGIGIAFLWEALDTRVRRAEDVAATLRLPLLGRVPEPPRRLRTQNRLAMLEDPGGPEAEAFRMLRTNLEFANLDRDARTIMVTSAVQQEGKSTTAANLAVALARAGTSVALVDLDLRRPFVHRFFDADGRPGLTNVALGRAKLEDALTPVVFAAGEEGERASMTRRGNGAGGQGMLFVLGSGPLPPDAGEFVTKKAVGEILAALRERVDVVIVDSPPLLGLGDALALSTRVDAVVVVARLGVVTRDTVRELHRVLQTMPATPLGLVATGRPRDKHYGYGYAHGSSTERELESERVPVT